MLRRQPLRPWVQPIGEDSALRREAVTMGFYTGVTLSAALAATIAIQLVRDSHAKHSTAEHLTAHLLLPSIAAAAASLVVLLVPNDVKLLAGRLTAALLLAVLVATETRRGGTSAARSARLALLAFGCAAAIAVLKRVLF